MTTYEKWTLPAIWLGALGTCGTVVYALFGAMMRRWFNSPKLVLDISETFPHCMLVKRDNQKVSNSDFDVVEICASIVNTEKWCAKNSRVMCTSVYVPEADGAKYCKFVNIRPCQFQWLGVPPERCFGEIDIAQSVLYYAKIAEISKPQNEMSANGIIVRSKGEFGAASVTVAVKEHGGSGAYIRIPFEHKSVLIAVCVSCSGNKPINRYIKIDWKGSSVNEFEAPGKFKVISLSDKDGIQLIKS